MLVFGFLLATFPEIQKDILVVWSGSRIAMKQFNLAKFVAFEMTLFPISIFTLTKNIILASAD